MKETDTEILTKYPILRKLLLNRGIKEEEDVNSFIFPDYDLHTHDPFLLPDIERAVERIFSAINKNEKIVIFADYDADGIPGAVVLNDFFKKIGYDNFEVYIPHRYQEGFGLNIEAIEEFAKNNISLIITVDCGSADVLPVERANDLGIDIIITDHHNPSDPEPSSFALVNPKKKGSKYPFKELSGAGVAFKLVQALLGGLNHDSRFKNLSTSPIPLGWEKWLLDMVAIATLSDMVPLVGENRVLARYGLVVLKKSSRPGLKTLLKKLSIDQKNLTEDDIGFMITPRINAASRMGEPMDAFRLLSADNSKEATDLTDHLDHINNERKGLVASMVKEAKKRIDKLGSIADVLVIGDPRWRPGLVGLAAQRLSEDYDRPTFVWGREGGEVIRGSARSNGDANVVSLMNSCQEVFIEYGGHDFSGGFSVSHENIHILEETLLNSSKKLNSQKDRKDKESISADLSMDIKDVNWKTWEAIDTLSPFGTGNPKPVFSFKNIAIKEVRIFGKTNDHLEVIFVDTSGGSISAISFFSSPQDFGNKLSLGEDVELLASIEKSVFRGRPELRLRIIDII